MSGNNFACHVSRFTRLSVVLAKFNASAAFRSRGALSADVNCAVKSIYLLSFLEVFADGHSNSKNRRLNRSSFRIW